MTYPSPYLALERRLRRLLGERLVFGSTPARDEVLVRLILEREFLAHSAWFN